MLTNYLKTALRNLWRNKVFSAINISGLSLGMTCGLLILLWVQDEKSVNAFHANQDRLFQIYNRGITEGKVSGGYGTQGLLADELKKQLPQVEAACELSWTEHNTFAAGDKILKQDANHAGADFFKVFSFPLLEGDAAHALMGPNSMAISRKMAVAFFGSPAAAMGRAIRYENQRDFQVTAVFEDLPHNVTEHFDCLINWEHFLKQNDWLNRWGNFGPSGFVLLKPGASVAAFESQLLHFTDKYWPPQPHFRLELGAQRLGDVYLYGDLTTGYPAASRAEYVRLFSIIAFFILVIACVNFMNLTTARSTRRAKEIGVRKVMGAARALLMRQFIGEALLTAVIAGVLAAILVGMALPGFNALTGKSLTLPYNREDFWVSLGLVTLGTGLLSGLYPAFYLSAFNPIRVLKGMFSAGRGTLSLRKGLVVFQFTLSIVLILSSILIVRQIRYITQKDIGYSRDNLLYVPLDGELTAKYDVFKTAALKFPGVDGVTQLSDQLTSLQNATQDINWDGKPPSFMPNFAVEAASYDFTRTMNLRIVQGRDFSKDFAGDSNAYIVNEAALAQIGYKDPIGRSLTFWGQKGTIIGIVHDFNFESMHYAIRPIIFRKGLPSDFSYALVKIRQGQTAASLAAIGQLCHELNPKFPFTYQFADEQFTKLYQSERVTGGLAVVFAALAIFISCLGLLGLSMFSAERRSREISIRKVLGAGGFSLFRLLTAEFLVLVGISFAIAVPAGWWYMHQWLQHYSYQTDIPWWLFALAGVLAFGIAIGTIFFQTLRALMINPAVKLRSE